jgi:hypothetical protein
VLSGAMIPRGPVLKEGAPIRPATRCAWPARGAF